MAIASKWSKKEPINVLELEALLLGIRHARRSPATTLKRDLFGLDSTVALGAAGKGRSSSANLNKVARKLCAHFLWAGVEPIFFGFPQSGCQLMSLHGEDRDFLASLQQSPDSLSMCRVNENTLVTYRKAVDEFLEFCQDRRLVAYSPMRMDEHLALFGNTLYQTSSRRGQRQNFVNAVMGIELLNPHLKGHLLRSRAVYAGWDKMSPSSSPPPVPVALLAVLVLNLRSIGQRTAGLGILLAFHALLRIHELLRLNWEDVLLPVDCRLPHSCRSSGTGGVLIRVAKTGRLQFVALTDEKLLLFLAKESPGSDREKRWWR